MIYYPLWLLWQLLCVILHSFSLYRRDCYNACKLPDCHKRTPLLTHTVSRLWAHTLLCSLWLDTQRQSHLPIGHRPCCYNNDTLLLTKTSRKHQRGLMQEQMGMPEACVWNKNTTIRTMHFSPFSSVTNFPTATRITFGFPGKICLSNRTAQLIIRKMAIRISAGSIDKTWVWDKEMTGLLINIMGGPKTSKQW